MEPQAFLFWSLELEVSSRHMKWNATLTSRNN